jgi:hypothetical protein
MDNDIITPEKMVAIGKAAKKTKVMQVIQPQAVQSDEISRDTIIRWTKDAAALSDLVRLYRAAKRLATADRIVTEREHQDHRDAEAAEELREVMARFERLRRDHHAKNWAKRRKP